MNTFKVSEFLILPLPQIENLETTVKLIVLIALSVWKFKIFFEIQVNRPHVTSRK